MARNNQGDDGGDFIDTTPGGAMVPAAGDALTLTAADTEELDIAERIRLACGSESEDKVTIKVYCDGKWCDDLRFSEYESGGMKMLRDRYGAGFYELRIYGPRGLIKGGKPRFNIAPAPARTESAASNGSDTALILRAMQEQNAAFMSGIAAVVQQIAQRPAEDPQAAMRNMFAIMKDMREAMGITNAPAAVPAQSPIQLLNETLGVVAKLREAAGELSPKEPADTESLGGMFSSLMETVRTVAPHMRLGGTPQQPQQPFPALSVPGSINENPAPVPAAQAEPGEDPNMMAKLFMQGATAKLLEMARANTDHGIAARWVYENLPDDMYAALSLPNWFDILAQFAPELAQHRPWAEAVKLKIDELARADQG